MPSNMNMLPLSGLCAAQPATTPSSSHTRRCGLGLAALTNRPYRALLVMALMEENEAVVTSRSSGSFSDAAATTAVVVTDARQASNVHSALANVDHHTNS